LLFDKTILRCHLKFKILRTQQTPRYERMKLRCCCIPLLKYYSLWCRWPVQRECLPRFNPPVRSCSISAPTHTSRCLPFSLLNCIPARLEWQQRIFLCDPVPLSFFRWKKREASRVDIWLSPEEKKSLVSIAYVPREQSSKQEGHHLFIHCRIAGALTPRET
jgi:hypothetical protein